jgi:hypothetical protein
MKRKKIANERFRVEWVSAGEGKKWQGIMTEMSEVAEKNRHASVAAAKQKKTKMKPGPKKSTKAKAATKGKPKPKKTAKKKQSKK